MGNYQSYKDYNVEDFLDNDFFIEWVISPTSESNQFWEGFLNDFPGKRRELNNSRSVIKALLPMDKELSANDKEVIWNNIKKSTLVQRVNKKRQLYWIAAASIFAIIASSILFLFIYKGNSEIDYAGLKANVKDSEEIRLILADHTEMNISKSESELKYDTSGQLTVNSLVLNLKSKNAHGASMAFNQLVVPLGKRSSIIFPDGTKLWLNSGSTAIYPVEFSEKKREIFIEGEAYLDVSHDKDRPFIVKTEKMDVRVLGTSFNICAYPEDKMFNTVLVKGIVKASFRNHKDCMLKPNQMISYDQKTNTVNLKKVDVFEYISWKDGWLLCNSLSLEKVFIRLSRYYNREIVFGDNKARLFQLSGKLDLKENLDQVLHIIESTVPVNIENRNKQIVISSK